MRAGRDAARPSGPGWTGDPSDMPRRHRPTPTPTARPARAAPAKAAAARVAAAKVAAALAGIAALVVAAPAAAHPFGPPSIARISADGAGITITWWAAEDDWVALGQSLGAFEDPAAGPVITDLTGEEKLARSAAVRDYLTERIAVRQDDVDCPATLLPLEELVERGARFEFDCTAPVTEIEVRLAALTDLHTAYRTVLTADGAMTPGQALFTAAEPAHRVTLADGGGGPSAAAGMAAGTATALAAGLAVLAVRRRRGTAARMPRTTRRVG